MGRPPKDPNEPDPGTAIQRFVPTQDFVAVAQAACFALSSSNSTRKAYWSDARHWVKFCHLHGVDLWEPHAVAVTAWLVEMQTNKLAPKTQNRRMAALSSIYDRIRRDYRTERPNMVNPFDKDHGPRRGKAPALEPTPLAQPEDVNAMLASCVGDPAGVRDAALLRTMWSTGVRCASMVSMTHERIAKDSTYVQGDGPGYLATVSAKGGKEVRILIAGLAGTALEAWLADLKAAHFDTGPIWRKADGTPMNEKAIWKALKQRAAKAGVTRSVSPHMFRVSFLTYNPASIQAKQSAAGHADPKTTASYDRHESWKGREAFEQMPDPEDL